MGNKNPVIVPATDFDTADGRRVSIHAGTDPLFRRLAEVIDQPELATDERFATGRDRVVHQEELYDIVATWVAKHPADDLADRLNAAGIPTAPIMSIADILADPHYRERGTITTVSDPEYGEVPMAAPLPAMSATPGRIRRPAPALGADNAEVYRGLLGLSDEQLEQLHADGVV